MPVKESDIPRIAKDSAAIYKKWQSLIDRYHGGMPKAAVAIRMKVESGGIMDLTPGGGSLKEIGLLSVTANQEKRFSVPDGFRMTPDGNVFLACLRYNVDTALFRKRYPSLMRSWADSHICGQLVAGIGVGAANYLFNKARSGMTYKQFSDWVQTASLPETGPWGSQTLETVRYRVKAFWIMNEAGKLMEKQYGISNQASEAVVPPLPQGIRSFKLPKEASFMTFKTASLVPGGNPMVYLVIALVVWYMFKQR